MVEKVTTRLDIADVAGKLIKAIDSNGDGSISYDEVIKHAEVFGGETKDFYKDTDVLFIKVLLAIDPHRTPGRKWALPRCTLACHCGSLTRLSLHGPLAR
jgi:hypothetical protein